MFFAIPQAVFSTTVLQVDVDFLLEKAVLIFEGEVVASEARWNHDQTNITTFITFEVKDVIKGTPQSSIVTIEFAGGTLDNTGLQVSGMVYPSVGESGIYFFENPEQKLVNPLVGWGQGHFRVKKDSNGMERILTEGDTPVLGLDTAAGSTTNAGNGKKLPVSPFSRGVAKGVHLGKPDDALHSAMEKKQFKDALKGRLAATKSKSKSPSKPAED